MIVSRATRGDALPAGLTVLALAVLTAVAGCSAFGTSVQRGQGRELQYFEAVAFGAEEGATELRIRKWRRDIRFAVLGSPTDADLAIIDRVIAELNGLVAPLEVSRVTEGPNALILFLAKPNRYIPDPAAVRYTDGKVSVFTAPNGEILAATVFIPAHRLEGGRRAHVIREEMTQGLGLLRDSWWFPDSIFYEGVRAVTEFAAIDRYLIRTLYRPEILPGMSIAEARAALNGTGAPRL